jgi:3'(2'), 5'-bisphosphate nucleotidase
MHELTVPLYALCDRAGDVLRQLYCENLRQPLPFDTKPDATPVTIADRRSNAILQEGLDRLYPGGPILSEEAHIPTFAQRSQWREYWLVDPLDGTREFIDGTGQFCISIARIAAGVPVLGAIYMPLTGEMYLGGIDQPPMVYTPREQRLLQPRPASIGALLKVLTSRRACGDPRVKAFGRHLQGQFPWMMTELRGSAWKYCRIAEGGGHVYPRFGATSEWDTAAGQALLEAAGGTVVDMSGQPLRYNLRPVLQNPPFVALAPASFDWQDVLPQVIS